jgi:hypothetical protein
MVLFLSFPGVPERGCSEKVRCKVKNAFKSSRSETFGHVALIGGLSRQMPTRKCCGQISKTLLNEK